MTEGAPPGLWQLLLKLAISSTLVVLLLHSRHVGSIIEHILAIDRVVLAGAAACYAAVGIPSSVRWSIVVHALGYRLSVVRAFLIILIGYFFNLTLVSAIGGDAVRMWEAYRAGLPQRVAITSVVIERLLQALAHLALVGAGLVALLYARIGSVELRVVAALLVAASIPALFVLVGFDLLPIGWQRTWVIGRLAAFSEDLRRILWRPGVAVPALLLGFMNQLGVLYVTYLLARGLGLSIGFVPCLIVIPVAMLATAIPISIAGWGVREGAFIVGFGVLGVNAPDALTLSLSFGALNTAVRLPGGLLWLAMKRESVVPDHDQGLLPSRPTAPNAD